MRFAVVLVVLLAVCATTLVSAQDRAIAEPMHRIDSLLPALEFSIGITGPLIGPEPRLEDALERSGYGDYRPRSCLFRDCTEGYDTPSARAGAGLSLALRLRVGQDTWAALHYVAGPSVNAYGFRGRRTTSASGEFHVWLDAACRSVGPGAAVERDVLYAGAAVLLSRCRTRDSFPGVRNGLGLVLQAGVQTSADKRVFGRLGTEFVWLGSIGPLANAQNPEAPMLPAVLMNVFSLSGSVGLRF